VVEHLTFNQRVDGSIPSGLTNQQAAIPQAKDLVVTVITPTYNQAQYIAACIDSVLGQTHRAIEYLIFDACSNDGTDQVVTRYLGDSRVRYIRERDRGQSNAINKGFDLATGDIVCWLNSDDFFYDSKVLEKICGFFAQNPGVDAVTGDGYLAGADGALLSPLMAERDRVNARGMAIADYFMQPSTFWRRNDIRLDEGLSYAFDWKFFVAMYKAGKSLSYLPGYFAVYRPHEASKTTQDSAHRRHEICHVLDFAGAGLPQRIWCRIIYGLYVLSESLRLPPLKTFARLANGAMRRVSRGYVYSC
jgi:glycosyltransferase involved in cell wall biosynthesis